MAVRRMKLLVVDDDTGLLALLSEMLQDAQYHVRVATTGQQALAICAQSWPDLVLLDIGLPDVNGVEVCRRVRTYSTVMIYMLSARAADKEKIRGLQVGADDYITKPFSAAELLARLRGAFRRMTGETQNEWTVGPFVVDNHLGRITRDERDLLLTPLEFRLCAYLLRSCGRVRTYRDVITYVWDEQVTRHVLWVAIHRLRAKVEDDPTAPRFLHTKPGIGYCFSLT